jgi:hypothetical protein
MQQGIAMANQHESDPRQLDFLDAYFNPKSKTYSNAYRSAKAVGYSESYSTQIKNRSNWLPENVQLITKEKLVLKAKKNLDKLLDSKNERIQADITKFVAKSDNEFSEKSEHKVILPQPIMELGESDAVLLNDSHQEN